LTAFSSASLAGLISDRQRSWDSPFGAFSSRRAPQHSCCADPRAVSSRLRHLRCRKRPRTTPRLLGFGPAPSPSRLGQSVRPDHRRKLLWASPLLGVSHRPACCDSRRNSSYVLSGSADGGHPGRMHLRVSIARRLPRPVAGPGPLLGSHTFPFPSVRAANNPGYVFTSPGRHHYWWPHRILGLSRLCRSRPDRTSVPGERNNERIEMATEDGGVGRERVSPSMAPQETHPFSSVGVTSGRSCWWLMGSASQSAWELCYRVIEVAAMLPLHPCFTR
jgi:hypothetical protein